MATWPRTKLTIDDMRQLAKSHGGECLSEEYRGNKSKLRWRCREGHEWETRPEYIRGGHWCSICASKSRRRYTIEDMQRLAAEHGGKCISQEYVNYRTPLEWECGRGHRFTALFWRLRNGRWCARCTGDANDASNERRGHTAPRTSHSQPGRRKRTAGLDRAREVAASHGGKCLSQLYVQGDDLMQWECALGHRWPARYKNVVAGNWCPACAIARRIEAQKALLGVIDINGADELLAFAESHGLELVQNGPARIGRHDFFRCETGHMWELHRNYVSSVVWCPACGKWGEAMRMGRIVR